MLANMSTDDRELEALLRRALHEHAEKVVPVGDGLAKIQQRAANRRRRLVWLRPSIAVAAAAVAAAAAIAIPTAIHRIDNGNSGTEAGKQPTTTAATKGATSAVKPSHKPTPGVTRAGPLTPVAMSWPYSSKAVAARSGDTSLHNPEQLATTFVASFTGADTAKSLNATTPNGQSGRTVTVDVRRGAMLVSQVQLDQVAKSSYVVTTANGTNVRLSQAALSPASNSIAVGGTFKPDGQADKIWAGAGMPYDKGKADPIRDSTAAGTPWQLTLNAPDGTAVSGLKILAAWTVDQNGQLLDFTATAAN